MSGPKRNPDKLNTIGVVVVGICGAVLVYVTIVALQAFYVDDTSEIQTMADYGGQDIQAKNVRTQQTANLNAPSAPNPRAAGTPQTYRIPLKYAMKHVVDAMKADPTKNAGNLVPALGRSEIATTPSAFGRPKVKPPDPGAGSAAPPPPPPPTDAGSAAPQTPTGGTGPGGGTAPQIPPTPTPTPAGSAAPKGNAR